MLVLEKEGFCLITLGVFDKESGKFIDYLMQKENGPKELVKRDVIGWKEMPILPKGLQYFTGDGMHYYAQIYKRKFQGV